LVAAVAPEVPSVRHVLYVDDEAVDTEPVAGSVEYEAALAGASPERDFPIRSSDDLYIAYTGGTTGLPKGVMWRCEDIFFGALGGGDIFQAGNPVGSPEELVERLPDVGIATLTTPPFMHNSAHWGAFMGFYGGGKIVTTVHGRFDPAEIWRLVGAEGVNVMVVVGDAMAKPLLDHWSEHPGEYDPSSLIVIGSGGAVLSPANRARLAAIKDGLMVVDGMGSSELGTIGKTAFSAGEGAAAGGSVFTVNEQTAVLDDELRRVEPGSGEVGQLARTGHIPLGYYSDEEKTARTFVTDPDGTRWALAGDMATVDVDGVVHLLGRGSVTINTGGEKVHPEEVEVAVRDHPDVADVLVVGIRDERWGEAVVAVVQPRPGTTITLEAVVEVCRGSLAGYKIPKRICLVDQVERSPAGKADYRWAKERAAANP
jgi:fatty-acyl-CoA synthase